MGREMIHSELIMGSILSEKFHQYVKQLLGYNPASELQQKRRPRTEKLYPLAYFKLFNDRDALTQDVTSLFGMLHFGMLSAGNELDMSEVSGWPHGLKCLQSQPSRRGVSALIMTGDGETWVAALRNAGDSTNAVQEWGKSCYSQFAKHNLSECFGTIQNKTGSGYLLS